MGSEAALPAPRVANAPPSPADSLSGVHPETALTDLQLLQTRRHTFVVLFRVVLISLVLGVTTLLYWLADADLTTSSSLAMFVVIGLTYLLTIAYSLAIRSGRRLERLGVVQLIADLGIATIIVHATGGAHSAYTFFFPLAIIGAALLAGRRMTIVISVTALALFVSVSVLGWLGFIPAFSGQEIRPDESTSIEMFRALALNGAAMIGVSLLAINLGSQLQQTRSSLVSQTSAAADLRTLHSDIVRSLASGLITVDTSGAVNSINAAAQRILGNAQVVGEPLTKTMPALAEILASASDEQRINRIEVRVGSGSDERVLGVSVSPLFDRKHQPVGRVVNFQDLTDLRQMETQVRRAERLAVIGRLAAGVAHEIRNPLASISGSIELLRSGPVESDEDRTLMDIVTREIDRLNQLITELLDYTNPGSMTRTELDVAALVADTAAAFTRDQNVATLDLDIALPDEPTPVSGDSEKLRQVLWNLLRNAAQAAGADGRVEVTVVRDAGDVIVLISDDGPGITREDQEKIFDPFFTTKEGGTGLGLAIAHSIIEEHGGRIAVDSAPGGGAAFRLVLPASGGQESTS